MNEIVFSGYLDVKISGKVNRGFTPWKAWHSRWCELKRLDDIENGAELKLKTNENGTLFSKIVVPRSSTVCRIESRSKRYAFGVFAMRRSQKSLLYLCGSSESDSQNWMSLIRSTLCISSYPKLNNLNFNVSLIDNNHSRKTNLTGLFGILSANPQGIFIDDPATSENVIKWKWHYFHQFHLQIATQPEDENSICVFHTNRRFISGPGQLHFYCTEASLLLELLLSHGKLSRLNSVHETYQRLSQSEGDLTKSIEMDLNYKHCLKNLSDSDDSGVRVSISSDDSESDTKNEILNTIKVLSKIPGDSGTEQENVNEELKPRIPRGESGVSLASGVYEEISEMPFTRLLTSCDTNLYTNGHMFHLYEDPEELSFKCNPFNIPPPLPPRMFCNKGENCDMLEDANALSSTNHNKSDIFVRGVHKYRSNTLPSKDLRRSSQTVTADSDYMVMAPKTKKDKTRTKNTTADNLYVPMSPINNLKTKLENYYVAMSGGKKC